MGEAGRAWVSAELDLGRGPANSSAICSTV